MVIFVCEKCKYTDLMTEGSQQACMRCGGNMVSLDINSADWNRLSKAEMDQIISQKIGVPEPSSPQEEVPELEEIKKDANTEEQETEVVASPYQELWSEDEPTENVTDAPVEELPVAIEPTVAPTKPEARTVSVKKVAVDAAQSSNTKDNKTTTKQKTDYKQLFILGGIVLLCLIGLGIYKIYDANAHQGQIQFIGSNKDFKGNNYSDIESRLRSAGYSNISEERIEDLVTGLLVNDGDVEGVVVNGRTDFTANDWFDPNASIVVRYHTFPAAEQVAEVPETESDTNDTSYEEPEVSEEMESSSVATENTTEADNETSAEEEEMNVYAYVKRGQEYQQFYIIDLPNKVVKWCNTDGDKSQGVIIIGEDLNEGISVDYNDYTEELSWKFVSNPATLKTIVDNEVTYFEKTDLDTAMKCWNL